MVSLKTLGNRTILAIREWEILFSYEAPVCVRHKTKRTAIRDKTFHSHTSERHVADFARGKAIVEKSGVAFLAFLDTITGGSE